MGKTKFCSFCNNEINSNNLGIEGVNARICFECLDLYHNLLEFQEKEMVQDKIIKKFEKMNITPKIIYQKLDKEVVGQNHAKKVLSVALYNHYLRIKNKNSLINKSNILMIGPSGVGKTLLAKTMASIIDVPIAICDATVYTQAGYVGEDVENILLRLIENADGNIELAEHGIVFIDEFDKLARKSENPSITRDVSGEGVQNALLKIIEGSIVNVPPQGGRKHPHQEYLQIDTSNILFICAGAFDGIYNNNKYSVGFNSYLINNDTIDVDKIIKYGIIPELVGRLPIITKLNYLSKDELKLILTKPSNSLTKQYQRLFSLNNVDLSFLDETIDYIAQLALKEKIGARSLKRIIEDIMLDTMFELPFDDGTNKVIIKKEEIIKQKII